jgi:gliding motility-associated-like protein
MHSRHFYLTIFLSVIFFSSYAQPCAQSLTASVSPLLICSDRPVNLSSSAIAGATYNWTGPAGFTSNLQNPVIASMPPLGGGIYTVTATIGLCVYTASVNIVVTLSPKISSVTNNSPVCPGKDVTLFGNATGAGGITYNWSGPAYSYSSSNNFATVPAVSAADAGIYLLHVVTTDGCTADSYTVVTVYPEVKADFDFTVFEKCEEKDDVVFRDKAIGAINFAWDFGDLTKGNGSPVSHQYPNQPTPPAISNTYTVTLIASSAHCSDTIQKNISIGHPLRAAFSVDDDSICQHTKVSFTDNSTVKIATAPAELWFFGDGATDNTILATAHTYDRPGVYNTKLIVTDYLGCKDSASHMIVVDSFGGITFNSSDDRVCLGNKIIFTGDYSPEGLLNATWDFADGNTLGGLKNIVHSYDKTGTYHVSFTADYRICPDTTFYKDVVIKPYPVIDLGPDKTICPNGSPLLFKDNINESNPLATWKWNTEVVNNKSYLMVYSPGTYAATVDIDGCSATDSVVVEKNCYINVPNVFTPNGDGTDDYFLPRDLLSRGLTKFNMTIFNRWGQVIFKTDNTNGRGWDGRFNGEPQPMGVFVYMIDATFLNGASEKYQGNITLLR